MKSIQPIRGNPGTIPSSFRQAQNRKEDLMWASLKDYSLEDALERWYETLKDSTRVNYGCAFRAIFDKQLLSPLIDLQSFGLFNHENIVDQIKSIQDWSEATRQARAAAYISFTGFLQRRTQGLIRKALPNKEGTGRTFFKVREKVKTQALGSTQTLRFLDELCRINPRDGLIAKLILQGGKRKMEVLLMRAEQIDFERHRISFVQSKTRGVEKETIIHYPEHVMTDLKEYLGSRKGIVFVSRNGKSLSAHQIDRNFLLAGKRAGIPFRVTPHVLRVTLVTRMKEMGIQDSDIMKITGHVNPAQLSNYDKRDPADNPTMKIRLV